MEPISNAGRLIETLRKQLVSSEQKTNTAAKASATAKGAASAARSSIEELQRKVREKLRHIDPHEPRARHKAIHAFLESLLLWEFGESLMEDPKFYALLDEVQHSMESDPQTHDSLSSLIEQLR